MALITDGRFSGRSHGFIVGHVTPEAQEGGPIALIRDGDFITIDARKNSPDMAQSTDDRFWQAKSLEDAAVQSRPWHAREVYSTCERCELRLRDGRIASTGDDFSRHPWLVSPLDC